MPYAIFASGDLGHRFFRVRIAARQEDGSEIDRRFRLKRLIGGAPRRS